MRRSKGFITMISYRKAGIAVGTYGFSEGASMQTVVAEVKRNHDINRQFLGRSIF